MKQFAFISSAALVALTACVKVSTEPVDTTPEPVSLRATVTPDNHCTVEALGATYSSIGQVRGATLPTFVGTIDNGGYHGIGCWVAGPNGSDGDLLITFAGNSLNEPFRTGTFTPTFDPPYGSSDNIVAVSFRASTYNAANLRTVRNSTGTVTVTSGANGERTIVVDVTAVRYEM